MHFMHLEGSGFNIHSNYLHEEFNDSRMCELSHRMTGETRCMIWTTFTYSHFAVSREAIETRTLDDFLWIDERFHLSDRRCTIANATFGQLCCNFSESSSVEACLFILYIANQS